MRTLVVFMLCTLLVAPVAAQEATSPGPVFRLVLMRPDASGVYHGVTTATGFLIGDDGTALTVSHFASRAHPDDFIIAIIGKEFYSADVVCASKLPEDPDQAAGKTVTPTRDVAEVKLGLSRAPFNADSSVVGDQQLLIATAHTSALPTFATLALASSGSVGTGGTVTLRGFGGSGRLPELWTASGTVRRTYTLRDGTPAIDFESTDAPATIGDNGAPLFDAQGMVVGMWTWISASNHTQSIAQGVDVLREPCR